MSKKTKKKKSLLDSRFYRIYFTVVGVALALILMGTVWLMGYLRDMEAAQPIYVAQDVARLFELKDFSDLYALDSQAQAISGGDKAFYVENLNKIAEGKTVAWSEGFADGENQHKYNVTLDGERFASFVLVPSGQKNRRGNTLWTLGYVTTNVSVAETPVETPAPTAAPTPVATTPVRVVAPKDYVVTVDGMTLTEDNATLTRKPMYEEGFLPEGVENPVFITYDYGSTSAAPQVTIADTFGTPVQFSQTAENSYACGLPMNDTLRSQYSDAALTLAQKIARFTSKDGSKSAILSYCAKNSPARTVFDNLSNQYATPHNGITFQNENVGEFYELGGNCFTCRVTFDYLLNTKVGVQTDPTAYTFCIIQQGDGVKLYNLLMS